MAEKIDVHQHLIPPRWAERLLQLGSRHRPPSWSPEQTVAWMDVHGIATSILSLTAPGFEGWGDDEIVSAAREANEYAAGLVAKWPSRFGSFAILPLPNLDQALEEVSHALDHLHADGVVVFSNYGERYLGDPLFEPLWAELDRRSAIVLVHPTRMVQPELKGIPGPFVDFPFATTRAAVEMVMNGVMDRFENVRVILSHGGGFLPYAAHRFASFAVNGPPGKPASPTYDADFPRMLDKFRRFYLDTAIASSPSALPSLKAFADPSRILFGTDYPYAPGGVAETFTAMLDGSPLLTDVERQAIDRCSAEALFPRLRR